MPRQGFCGKGDRERLKYFSIRIENKIESWKASFHLYISIGHMPYLSRQDIRIQGTVATKEIEAPPTRSLLINMEMLRIVKTTISILVRKNTGDEKTMIFVSRVESPVIGLMLALKRQKSMASDGDLRFIRGSTKGIAMTTTRSSSSRDTTVGDTITRPDQGREYFCFYSYLSCFRIIPWRNCWSNSNS